METSLDDWINLLLLGLGFAAGIYCILSLNPYAQMAFIGCFTGICGGSLVWKLCRFLCNHS